MSRLAAQQEQIARFHQGLVTNAYDFMGAHPDSREGETGYVFRVWAPTAQAVSVVGDFNAWDSGAHRMEKVSQGNEYGKVGYAQVIFPFAHRLRGNPHFLRQFILGHFPLFSQPADFVS